MSLSYEIEIRCPKMFHNFQNEQPEERGNYLCYFADSRSYVIAEYIPDKKEFAYEDGEYFEKISVTEKDVFWAEIYDISNFIENYLI